MSGDFGFNCTQGGQWYACSSGSRFVGCCTSDPCSDRGCVQGNVRPAGFNPTMFGKFPDASCGTASNFYSCTAGNTFWGCCKQNPCAATPAATCPGDNLVPAFLERPEQINVYAPSKSEDGGSNKGAIIGGAVGGAAVLIIAVLAFLYFRRRKRSQQKGNNPENGEPATAATPMMGEKRDHQRLSEQYGGRSRMSESPFGSASTNSIKAPPMYAEPHSGFSQPDPLSKGHYQHNYQQYNYNAAGPSELPAESSSAPTQKTYSELPAETTSSIAANRASELPGGATHVASELESPQVSPRPLQGEFSTTMGKQSQNTTGNITGA